MLSLQPQEKIYVAGHRGMVGSAIFRALQKQGETNIVTRTHAELDLTNQAAVQQLFHRDFRAGDVRQIQADIAEAMP